MVAVVLAEEEEAEVVAIVRGDVEEVDGDEADVADDTVRLACFCCCGCC